MDQATPSDTAAPRRRVRDVHGRGVRGPGVMPPRPGRPHGRTARERFDAIVLEVVTVIEERWEKRLGLVEYAVEDTPMVPDDWDPATIPLSSLVRGRGGEPTRIVVFRRPIEHRSAGRPDLEALVHTVLVQQVAELLGLPPETVDPGYRPEA